MIAICLRTFKKNKRLKRLKGLKGLKRLKGLKGFLQYVHRYEMDAACPPFMVHLVLSQRSREARRRKRWTYWTAGIHLIAVDVLDRVKDFSFLSL